MNIALIGYRASGKTTIAKSLAEVLGWSCVGIDKVIEDLFKMKISRIVSQYGWDVFRKYEKEVIMKYSRMDMCILDLGGGVVINRENIRNIKQNALTFFLSCSPAVLAGRLKNSYFRPPLTDLDPEEEIRTVLEARLPLYIKCADYVINTEKQGAVESTLLILKYLMQYLPYGKRTIQTTGEYSYV